MSRLRILKNTRLMKYVEVIANSGSADTVAAIAEKVQAVDFRLSAIGSDDMQAMRILVSDGKLQTTLDTLQNLLGAQPTARIIVLPVEVTLPKPDESTDTKQKAATGARESLYEEVAGSVRLDSTFLLLVLLSTVVAAIGLIKDNIAVVIGAMVIAPLLGPNLALSLGTALGDMALIRKSVRTLLAGIFLAVLLSAGFGLFWPVPLDSNELLSRTDASLDSIVLALASGAAASLSLTTGLSGVLVGVMVAVALLPPAATVGIMLGAGQPGPAMGAALLLAINIVCVNLAGKLVFVVKGISPRILPEKEKARRAMLRSIVAWIISLAALLVLMTLRAL